MDEMPILNSSPWTPLQIGLDDIVYRQTHVIQLIHPQGDKKRRYPNESHFVPDADGLSVYWTKYIQLKDVYVTIGLSYKFNTTTYKDHTTFKIFKLPISFLKTVDGIIDVLHSPVYNGNPAPVGLPNIYAHSSIVYENDPEIRVKLSDYCRENHESCFCDFNVHAIDEIINELRDRLNDTPFHIIQ